MTALLPTSARLAWWGTAWLRGLVVTDLAVDAIIGPDATHAVAALPGADGTLPLASALGALRAAGATSLGLAVPAEGDPVGLGGPADFNAAALEAGEAVVVAGAGVGLVPDEVGPTTVWTAYAAAPRQLPDVGEADRMLRAQLVESADTLARLEVARWRPEAADLLLDLERRTEVEVPPGTPARCAGLAVRACRALEVVTVALADDGGALTSYEIETRRDALRPLAAAARRALVAACSPEVWPPA